METVPRNPQEKPITKSALWAALDLVAYMATSSPDAAHLHALEQEALDRAVAEARVLIGILSKESEQLCGGARIEAPSHPVADAITTYVERIEQDRASMREKLAFTEAVLAEARKDSDRLKVVVDEVCASDRGASSLYENYSDPASAPLVLEYRKGRADALRELVARLVSLGVMFVAVFVAGCGGSPPTSSACVATTEQVSVMNHCVDACGGKGGKFSAELTEGSCLPVTVGASQDDEDCFARCIIENGNGGAF